MSTYMAKTENVERKWYIIDAAGQPMGRVAAKAAAILNGKHKVTYTPHVDCGDFVIILNSEKAVLTGKKLTQKYYYRHSGYVGGLKETQYKTLMATKPNLAMTLAVKGMLQRTLSAVIPSTASRYLQAANTHTQLSSQQFGQNN